MAIPGRQDDLNAKVVSIALRDAGFEVVYLGTEVSPQDIIRAALHEDVDAIYLSVVDKSYMDLVEEILDIARKENFFNSSKKFIFLGGIDLDSNKIQVLKEKGLAAVYGPKQKTHEIINSIKEIFGYK